MVTQTQDLVKKVVTRAAESLVSAKKKLDLRVAAIFFHFAKARNLPEVSKHVRDLGCQTVHLKFRHHDSGKTKLCLRIDVGILTCIKVSGGGLFFLLVLLPKLCTPYLPMDGADGIVPSTICRGLDSNPRQSEEEKVEEICSE